MSPRFHGKAPYHFAHPLLRARDWQERPELEEICTWWRTAGRGVCGLIGIGGAGKTALAERFLRILPGVFPDDLSTKKDTRLRRPQRLFVYSFYDSPNPDDFFTQLASWLHDARQMKIDSLPSYELVLRLLESAGPCLLVLDGLEKVQDDGSRGGKFGQVQDGRLRGLLLRIAEGRLSKLAALITTRFVLEDLQNRVELHYQRIGVDRISESACLALLRQRGVRGTDAQLREIAHDCGCHALTVDLAGGYIAQFGRGDPATRIDLTRLELTSEEVEQQTNRLERVAIQYRQALAQTDPAALALLERVCLFRLGVDVDTLTTIFTGSGKEEISGPALARLSLSQVRERLDRLVSLRLLEATERSDRRERPRLDRAVLRLTGLTRAGARHSVTYNIHPAVREAFVRGLDPAVARRGHQAAYDGLISSLGGMPGRQSNPSDPETLDLLEEIIHHTLASGNLSMAWELYGSVLGGYTNLGTRLGAYERGERICRAFVGGQSPENAPLPDSLSVSEQAYFANEWALFLSDLGRLDASVQCYGRNIELRLRQQGWKNASIGNQNLCDLLVLSGHLSDALRVAEEALELANLARYGREQKDCLAHRAHVRGLLGDTGFALEDFAAALHEQQLEEGTRHNHLFRLRGVQHAWLLVRLGRLDEAHAINEANLQIVRERFGEQSHHVVRCWLLRAQIARRRGQLDLARAQVRAAQEWAIIRDAQEFLCWAGWEQGCIALDEARTRADRPFGSDTLRHLQETRQVIDDGLWSSREYGFALFHHELLLLRAEMALEMGDPTSALTDLSLALDQGHAASPRTGQPSLLALTHPACQYAWGKGLGRHLQGEAHLLLASQRLGRALVEPNQQSALPLPIPELIETGRQYLEQARAVRERINDPALSDTLQAQRRLAQGELTRYPLRSPVTLAVSVEPIENSTRSGHS